MSLVVLSSTVGVAGFIIGGVVSFFITRSVLRYKYKLKEEELNLKISSNEELYKDKLMYLKSLNEDMETRFKALSGKVLEENSASFCRLAQAHLSQLSLQAISSFKEQESSFLNIVSPIKESLAKVDQKILDLESQRLKAYEGMHQQIKDMMQAQLELRNETHRLSSSLRSPTVRGRWGEMQLRRVVELSGMERYCDFEEQYSQETSQEDGRDTKIRPDLIVKLPDDKIIIVDAKTPLASYLEAISCEDDDIRSKKFLEHASHLKKHIHLLAGKSYWKQFNSSSLELVIMFVPGDSILNAAYQSDPSLLEYALTQKILIATPTTLIGILTAISQGWRNKNLEAQASGIIELGKTLYDRLFMVSSYIVGLGKNLKATVGSFNSVVSSMEKRVFVTARKFNEINSLDLGSIPKIEEIDQDVKEAKEVKNKENTFAVELKDGLEKDLDNGL